MKLTDLHRGFIKNSSRSIVESSLPVKAVPQKEPILAVERWTKDEDGFLTKRFLFENSLDKNRFVVSLLSYEAETGHYATMLVEPKLVILKLKTHDVGSITELDRAYCKYADIVRKDIAYNMQHDE
jgi:pterin-4a-carbinolamine dehydratase